MMANLAMWLLAAALNQTAAPPETAPNEPPLEPDEGRIVIDILAPVKPDDSDEIAYEECVAEQDAARIRGEIVVCRQRSDAAGLSGFDKEQWERDYAERTQGQRPADVEGVGGHILMPGEGSLVTITVTKKGCFVGPCAPEQPLFIDVEALPEAPPGSDADRIAKGLDPKGEP
ncbi:MAG: hypothetical protein AAF692_12225 [Pseudomonadota bacterium]